jgi:hypothetical protein
MNLQGKGFGRLQQVYQRSNPVPLGNTLLDPVRVGNSLEDMVVD